MSPSSAHGVSRRAFLRRAAALAAGVYAFPRWALAGADERTALILVWLQGGASQLETFDPKPGTPQGGPTRAIETALPGVRFAAGLPKLAERANRLCVLRSLSGREGDHRRASYVLHTGWSINPALDYPHLGALLDAERAAEGLGFVSLGSVPARGGFRGAAYAPLEVPNDRPPGGRAPDGFAARRELLKTLESEFSRRAHADAEQRVQAFTQAQRVLEGPIRGAWDLEQEPQATRDAYGASLLGRRLLVARRLVEAGARCVVVESPDWDHHEDLFRRHASRAQELDAGLSALLDDLRARKRWERTVVACFGEFGRTPTINPRQGRDHYPQAFSGLLAGGGLRPGVVGATGPDGARVVERPLRLADVHATLLARLGVDPAGQQLAGDRPLDLVDAGEPISEVLG
ncbi:MAG: DUF1501 domain-containing protein [Planctomycetes bacterium]|nr:DUF1501 domain-containing protein [Planctomycetota bacterium]